MPVVVSDAAAEPLPFDDSSFDAAVASVVLCTVPDQPPALQELRRVLKPGGELRFMEHVRAEGQRKARVQHWLDRSGVWPWLAGGCHCSRASVGAIEAAGFTVERLRNFDLGPSWIHTNPHVLGVARHPSRWLSACEECSTTGLEVASPGLNHRARADTR